MEKLPEELQLLQEWQHRLGLDDWFIVLETHCKQEALMDDADGDVEFVESTKCAKIQVIDPDVRKGALRPFDFEEILVHELLHCKFALLGKGEDWDNNLQLRIVHQLVDDMARALVSAKRNNRS